MINTPFNRMPFLITSRYFPPDQVQIQPVLNKAYIEIAQAVNARIIGNFEPTQSVTGETWFEEQPEGEPIRRRQTYRRVYRFDAIAAGATLTFNHNIEDLDIFTRIWGTAETATPDFRPIPYASATTLNTQIEVNVTATQINIINGAGAPNIVRGMLVLEYLLN